MLLELALLGLVAYLLLTWHRKEVEKGGEGLGAAGPILEEMEALVLKIASIFKKQAAGNTVSASKRGSTQSPVIRTAEASTQRASPAIAQVEKFESVRQPREPRSRSKHHAKHRSKMDSALKAASQN
ncbi:uncharacterized protein CELE_Y39A1A.24 [Caenorhabditis elegans]|uniref:Secreted protein n=1 Tax=Caenorhabditis elegans TaxID=6239 RepID=Q9XX20_CAEEL|nr:Secreted protein [Caenorhabditis elegans]CAA21020.1 Secreted protein [Caenorhabditis elegans]|eukprot:NP_499339.1 Uncharacterized protein CELE_Y39A1A.24 [Caenorhabditis elegans]